MLARSSIPEGRLVPTVDGDEEAVRAVDEQRFGFALQYSGFGALDSDLRSTAKQIKFSHNNVCLLPKTIFDYCTLHVIM